MSVEKDVYMQKPHLIVIGGATASGKTAAAVRLCEEIGGEVVSCDSMQIYRGMDIGTAKPTSEERRGVPHHMIDVIDPDESYSASRFKEDAALCVSDILSRGKQPVLCGGTGLYIDALTRPMDFALPSDPALREALIAVSQRENGKAALHAMLKEIDPESAGRLHPNDVRRVARAIEIYRLTGRTMTEQMALDRQREGDYRVTFFALNWPRDVLYDRIDRRVDLMMRCGLVDEVKQLLKNGLSADSTAMQALGYKEIVMALEGKCDMSEAVDEIKLGSRHYAKRQITWLRRDGRPRFIDAHNKTIGDIVQIMMGDIEHDNH